MIDVPARVRDALRDGRLKKNYKFKVLNDDGSVDFTIDNNTLVSETVKFDERMCSGDTIKFGLCEGSSLEFQYFDHDSIRGRRIYSEIEVEYEKPGVTKTLEQSDTETVTKQGKIQFYYVTTGSGTGQFRITHNGNTIGYNVWSGYSQTIMCYVGDVITAVTDIGVAYQYSSIDTYTIPMGFYEVDKCPMQYSTGIRKVTAYNKLKAEYLDQKANEIIKQIFADGVAGCDTSIDISILLEILLNDYSVESAYEKVDYCGGWETPHVVYTGDAFQNITRSDHTKSVWMIPCMLEMQLIEYPSASYIPEQGYYREPDWYYTGWLRWWANTKKIYDEMLSCIDFQDHLDDTYGHLYYGQQRMGTYTLRGMLKGESAPFANDYLTFKATMIAAAGSKRVVDLAINPGNYQSEGAFSDIIVHLKNMTTINPPVSMQLPLLFKEITLGAYEQPQEPYTQYFTQSEIDAAVAKFQTLFTITSYGVKYLRDSTIQIQRRTSPVSGFEISYTDVANLPDVTLRELQSALFEAACQYGQIDRVSDLFYGKELNNSWLYPRGDLYPADNLYPGGGGQVSERGNPSAYKTLWTDSSGEQSFRNLIITYKGLDENNQAKEFTLTKVVSASGTTDYICKDNWVFKNLVWDEEDIDDYADAMVAKLQEITWIPFEMWAAGLPYLETGDEIEITNKEGTFKSYVLQRVLSGIQNLQDTYINGTLEIF